MSPDIFDNIATQYAIDRPFNVLKQKLHGAILHDEQCFVQHFTPQMLPSRYEASNCLFLSQERYASLSFLIPTLYAHATQRLVRQMIFLSLLFMNYDIISLLHSHWSRLLLLNHAVN